jgi:hypothetical protein
MDPRALRFLYIAEFLVALAVTYFAWGQVGGQSHLDTMLWYWKLTLGLGLAFAVVHATAAAVEGESGWNSRTGTWIAACVVVLALMGLATYYEHLHENDDADQEQPAVQQTAVQPLQ